MANGQRSGERSPSQHTLRVPWVPEARAASGGRSVRFAQWKQRINADSGPWREVSDAIRCANPALRRTWLNSRKKSSRPSRRKFGEAAGTHTPYPLPAGHSRSSRLSQPGGGGSAGRRGRERRWEVRPALQVAGRTLGLPSQVSAESGGVEEPSSRLREEVEEVALSLVGRVEEAEEVALSPVGRVPNAGLRRLGPQVQPRRGEGRELGWDTRKGEEPSRDGKWAVGTQDIGSSSRQPRADFRGRKSLPGITLFMLCVPLVKLVTVSTRLFPS